MKQSSVTESVDRQAAGDEQPLTTRVYAEGEALAQAAREIVDVVGELEAFGPPGYVALVRAVRVADLIARERAGRAA